MNLQHDLFAKFHGKHFIPGAGLSNMKLFLEIF